MDTVDIMATGDSHFEEGPRFGECIRVHEWIACRVHERQPDLFAHPGDFWEKRSTADERLAVARFVQDVTNVCPMVVTGGNHDEAHGLQILRELRTVHPVYVVEGAEVLSVKARRGHVLGVAAVGWPKMAGATTLDAARDAMRDLLRAMREPLSHFDRRLLVGHFETDGAKTSSGQPMAGRGIDLALGDLALVGAQAAVLAHIHLPQGWVHDGVPYLYTGSPFRGDFGEHEEKSILELQLWDGPARWTRVPTPARPMIDVHGCYAGGHLAHDLALDLVGADVRLRYDVAAEELVAAKGAAAELKASWYAAGAAYVKVEPITKAAGRARAPEVAAAKSLREKLAAMWTARGDAPPPERAERLLGPRLSTLETA